MANYTKATDFAAKDALTTGDPAKIVKGNEIDAEFNAIATAINSKANTSSPTFTGIPAAPTAAAGTNTTQLATTAYVLANGVPSGAIMMWSGTIATIPSGWYLCDGTNGTPNLTNKFIIGADADSGGAAKTSITGSATQTGGSKDAIVVSHNHTADSAGAHQHYLTHNTLVAASGQAIVDVTSGNYIAARTTGNTDYAYVFRATGNAPNIGLSSSAGSHSHTINSTGSSGTNANLSPYFALAYIMKA
jgi:hypothetical protein